MVEIGPCTGVVGFDDAYLHPLHQFGAVHVRRNGMYARLEGAKPIRLRRRDTGSNEHGKDEGNGTHAGNLSAGKSNHHEIWSEGSQTLGMNRAAMPRCCLLDHLPHHKSAINNQPNDEQPNRDGYALPHIAQEYPEREVYRPQEAARQRVWKRPNHVPTVPRLERG